MLPRMYLRWAERRGFKVEMKEASEGEEAGHQVGHLRRPRRERLRAVRRRARRAPPRPHLALRRAASAATRPSPRSTSAPLVDDEVEVDIDEEDLRIDTYRASGAGGQHVNKTDSAVRITHVPTGHRRPVPERALAGPEQGRPRCALLRRSCSRSEERKRAEALAAERGEQKVVEWGSQIRSYTLHPSQRVKDHRTGTRWATRSACSMATSTASSASTCCSTPVRTDAASPSQSGSRTISTRRPHSMRPPPAPARDWGSHLRPVHGLRGRSPPGPRRGHPRVVHAQLSPRVLIGCRAAVSSGRPRDRGGKRRGGLGLLGPSTRR